MFRRGVHQIDDAGAGGIVPRVLRGLGLGERVEFLPLGSAGGVTRGAFDNVGHPALSEGRPRIYGRAVPGPIQSIERAAAILAVLAETPDGAAISDVAATLGLSRSTVHGLLQTMREVGFVHQPTRNGRYAVSPYPPGSRMRPVDPNLLRSAAMSWADGLADRSGQSVHIAVRGPDKAMIVHHVLRPDGRSQTMESGSELPLHATALGKVLVADRPGLRPDANGRTLTAFTARTLTTPAVLARELAMVRGRGWAAEIGEYRLDRASIAAPIRFPNRSVVAAISVTGPVEEIASPAGQVALVPRVRQAAADIEHTLKGMYGAAVCHVVGTGHFS